MLAAVGQDPGLGGSPVTDQLRAVLQSPLKSGSQHHRALRHLTDFAAENYLRTWRIHLEARHDSHVERASRLITAHVLDAGLHPTYAHREARKLIRSGASLTDLVDEFAR
jgi:hypothetical protein